MKELYFDAEWVLIEPTLEQLKLNRTDLYEAFLYKVDSMKKKNELWKNTPIDELYVIEGGYFPELIKIVTISVGYEKNGKFLTKSFYGSDEKKLLSEFALLLNKVNNKMRLVGYYITRFDMPYIAKRMVINKIVVPDMLNMYGVKSWDRTAVDINEIWGFGSYQNTYTPLPLLSASLGFHSSKSDEVKGSEVTKLYYNGELEKIKTYCEKDVVAVYEIHSEMKKYIKNA